MHKVDGFHLYQVGTEISRLGALKGEFKNDGQGTTYNDAFFLLHSVDKALMAFLDKGGYSLKAALTRGTELKQVIAALMEKAKAESDEAKQVQFAELSPLEDARKAFEAALVAELTQFDLYSVNKKGGYGTADLMSNGHLYFPADLEAKVPQAIADLRAGAKCVAVELPAAAGFYLFRAAETVLRKYWDAVTKGGERPRSGTMNDYIQQLELKGAGSPYVLSALKDLKAMHRNEMIHAGYAPENIDESIALMNHIHTVMVHMLKLIPSPNQWLIEAPVQAEAEIKVLENKMPMGMAMLSAPVTAPVAAIIAAPAAFVAPVAAVAQPQETVDVAMKAVEIAVKAVEAALDISPVVAAPALVVAPAAVVVTPPAVKQPLISPMAAFVATPVKAIDPASVLASATDSVAVTPAALAQFKEEAPQPKVNLGGLVAALTKAVDVSTLDQANSEDAAQKKSAA